MQRNFRSEAPDAPYVHRKDPGTVTGAGMKENDSDYSTVTVKYFFEIKPSLLFVRCCLSFYTYIIASCLIKSDINGLVCVVFLCSAPF